ncbi:4Fe-4S dicluster domain-containing protein [candidate division TA06 bacterium]|uniref:4Fe-4S dicluster domain-containing protein n=1 Tax=candidate division TA06 bacterium TaxID=2250710 RepID=A0A933IBB5_UNCT6|nr:4Fe-4S dicluster domain-containing protein [candidate division TA06 bacterium]
MIKSIKGGRAWPHKNFIFDQPIETLPAPMALAIPLWHGGRAVVAKGDKIKANSQVGFDSMGLPVFTGLAGKVTGVADFPDLVARPKSFDFPRTTVFIEAEPDQPPRPPAFEPRPRFWELSKAELADRVFQAGVADLRKDDLEKLLIFDGLGLEPPLSCNVRLLMERPKELLEGMRIVMQIHGSIKARLALSSRMKGLNADLKSLLASAVNISIEKVEPKYPQQHRFLINQSIYQGQPSAIYGMEALLNVRRAVALGQPLATKFCNLGDDTKGQKRLAEVYLGASAAETLSLRPQDYSSLKLISGGLMSGTCYYSLQLPVDRNTAGLLFYRNQAPKENHSCINCGQCLAICPVGLAPARIYPLVRDGQNEELTRLRPENCLECGLCTYACPSGLLLSHQIKVGKLILEGKL